jgi:N-glycosidase YbiA
MIKIPHYETSYFLFSNFSAHVIVYKGITYPTLEHAFQAQKFSDEKTREEIRKASSPLVAFKIGRSTPNIRKDWKVIKINIMYELLKSKVEQHEEVRRKLSETGDEEIIEENPNDSFWGAGIDGKGENHMGKLLMKVREELKRT